MADSNPESNKTSKGAKIQKPRRNFSKDHSLKKRNTRKHISRDNDVFITNNTNFQVRIVKENIHSF